jgi:hypothetical protein
VHVKIFSTQRPAKIGTGGPRERPFALGENICLAKHGDTGAHSKAASPLLGDAGWSSPVARQAHNLKVVGSNPTPATKSPSKYNTPNTKARNKRAF